ncbi:MAG: glycosyltransferase [Elusimicrobia bacterium]|nr:glycosyltransferase [Candidatus Obscuribacterium magneticum]
MKKLLIIDRGFRSDPVSYSDDWIDAFRDHAQAKIDLVSNPLLLKWGRKLLRLLLSSSYDGIFVMHSVSNDFGYGYEVARLLRTIRGPKFMFMGNEYRELALKIALAHEMGCSFLISQLPDDVAQELYGPSFAGRIISIPHALNEKVFKIITPLSQRQIDIGYRGEKYPYYLGHNDREKLFGFFSENQEKYQLRLDFSSGRGKGIRLPRNAWARFLNSCRCTIATETGSEYLSLSDKLRYQTWAYLDTHPESTFERVETDVIKPLTHQIRFCNGRAISSRHFDAIGCGTCLISFPGRFNDILKSEEHYISVEREFLNIDSVISKIEDTRYLESLAQRTLKYVLGHHCLKHRITTIMDLL